MNVPPSDPRSLLTPAIVAGELRLRRGQPPSAGKSLVLVEGPTDERALRAVVCEASCLLFAVQNRLPGGARAAVLAVLAVLEGMGLAGVLAVVDADFDVLEGRPPQSANVLLTDGHDLEAMMLRSPALEKVLGERAGAERLASFTQQHGPLREVLLRAGAEVGCLRWLSLRQGVGLWFEDLSFGKFIDKKTLVIDRGEALRLVYERTVTKRKGPPLPDRAAIAAEAASLRDGDHDPWHLCCGHDLVAVLCVGLGGALGSAGRVEPEEVERELRLAYERAFFAGTPLAESIRAWEQRNPPFRVLPPA